jgi:hypothetical protein
MSLFFPFSVFYRQRESKKKGGALCAAMLAAGLSVGAVHAQEAPMSFFDNSMVGVLMDQQKKKPKTDEESIAMVESYLLEMMFLRPMLEKPPSVLTEEEQTELGSMADTTFQNEMFIRELATRLSQKDILGLKKKLLKHGSRGSAVAARTTVKTDVSGFVIGKVPE